MSAPNAIVPGRKPGKVYYSNAGPLNRLTFTWVNRLLARGRQNKLKESDLELPAELKAKDQSADFEKNWEAEKTQPEPSLARALLKTYSSEILQVALLKLLWGATLIFTAFYLVRSLVAFMADKNAPDGVGWGFSFGFFGACIIMSVCLQQLNHQGTMTGIRVRSALSTAVYQKALRTENIAQHSSEVLNLLTNDCCRMLELCVSGHYIWSAPLEALTIIILLISLIGNWGLIALALMVILIASQVFIGKRVAALRNQNIAATDERVHLMHEILMNIKLVKFYAWEESFLEKVAGLRLKEIDVISKAALLKSINLQLVFVAPPAIALLLFSLYVVYSSATQSLAPTLAFTTLSLFNTLRFSLVVLPKGIKNMAESLAALRRLQTFLLSSDVKSVRVPRPENGENGVVQFEHADIAYRKDVPLDDEEASSKPVELATVLRDIHIKLEPGRTLALVGPVGSGKSSVLLAALGETRVVRGNVRICGSVAYVPQYPWVQAGTLRNNILFGLPYDEDRYRRVIHACALERDLEIMPQGDMSIVAERGTNLSGGQRQRVSLARAAYANADIYLLDSPLSAVDWHTCNHIMHFCIKGLLKGKTIIMVTHQLSLLADFDVTAIVKEGRFDYCGPFNTEVLLANFPSFADDYAAMQANMKAESADSSSSHAPAMLFGPDNHMMEAKLAKRPEIAQPSYQPSASNVDDPYLERSLTANEIEVDSSETDSDEDPQSAGPAVSHPHQELSSNQVVIHVGASNHQGEKEDGKLVRSSTMSRADVVQLQLQDIDRKLHQVHEAKRRLSISADGPAVTDTEVKNVLFAYKDQLKDEKSAAESKKSEQQSNHVEERSLAVEKALQAAASKIAEEEAKQDTSKALFDWMQAGGFGFAVFSFVVFVVTQVNRIISDWWISQWTTFKFPGLNSDRLNYVYIYIGLVLSFATWLIIRGLVFYNFATSSATLIHNRMFSRILHAPMSFFTLRQLGGVLDAFSRHQDIIDEALPDTMHMTIIYGMIMMTTILLVVVVIPIYIVVVVVLMSAVAVFVYFYISTANRLKQMVAESSSPLLSETSESLDGIAVVRAFNAEQRFAEQSMLLLDHHHTAFFSLEELQCWLAHRLDWMVTLLVLLTALVCVTNKATVLPSATGLAISNSLQALVFFTWWVRGMADCTSLLNSVSRIETLRESVEETDPHRIAETKPPISWPQRGLIEFKNVTLRYLPWLDPALTDVSFTIQPGEKIGVVGRTGSGKSTLIMALFRLVGIEGGSVLVDGTDIGKLGLADLRERLAIIPQEPVMFAGTVRSNLDPFQQHGDEDLWQALEVANLHESVKALPGGLNAEVQENGRNFSLGQRQLLCLSRAFLRKSSVLVLDEATASLDQDTDHFIQQTLRRAFAQCTIITIAHRLHSIIDSDRILAMATGRVVEFDKPTTLLEQPNSFFSKLVDQAGDQRDVLRSMVFEHARKKLPVPK